MLLPNENYFLPSTASRSGSRMPATSKKELFVEIAYSESHFWKLFDAQRLFLDGIRSLGLFLIKYHFIITIFIASFINCDYIEQDDSCYVKLKFTLPNIVITGRFGMQAISNIGLFVAIALHGKLLTFVAESSILERRSHAI